MNAEQCIAVVSAVLDGSYDYETEQLISVLRTVDDFYFNDNELITDAQYDAFRNIVRQMDPSNVYFTGVGAAVRGGKVTLPYEMPSLTQVEIGEIEKWVSANSLWDEELIITDKMDGASLMNIYDKDGDLQIAFSRGDGLQGADITRHVGKMKKCPQSIGLSMAIRCEVELSEASFRFLQSRVMSRSGEPYRNARNMVSGLMNAESNDPIVYDYLNVFAYSVLKGTATSKLEQLMHLKELGFDVPHYMLVKGRDLNDEFLANYINQRRALNGFAIDGIVIDVNRAELRRVMDSKVYGGNPRSAIKYKVADATNQHVATCDHVEWNVSKHGFAKPKVVLEPFDLCGVTIRHATGFNAKFIHDNKIGKGSKLLITRSGDVIPFIQQVVEGTVADMPPYACHWNATGVDLIVDDVKDNPEVKVQQLIDFCASLNFPHLKEGNVRALFEQGIKTPENMVNVSLSNLAITLGASGIKAYHGIQDALKDVALSDVMGAHPAFGRGIGQRKMKKLVEALSEDYNAWTSNDIVQVEGFDVKTAEMVMKGITEFDAFYNATKSMITYKGRAAVNAGKLTGQKIVMTGFRDKVLEKRIEDLGGENQSSVSAKTTIVVAADPESTSGKAQKARDITASGKGKIQIMSIKQFKDFIA